MRELPSCQRPRAKFAKRTQFSEWNQHLAAPALAAPAVTGGATEGNRLGPERLPLIGGGISEILIYPPDQLALVSSRFRRLGIFRGEIGKDGRRRPEQAIGDFVHDQEVAADDQGVKEWPRRPKPNRAMRRRSALECIFCCCSNAGSWRGRRRRIPPKWYSVIGRRMRLCKTSPLSCRKSTWEPRLCHH
jgi:hypothetical protein